MPFTRVARMFGNQSTGLEELLRRPQEGIWRQFIKEPCVYIAKLLYRLRSCSQPQPITDPIAVVCISDTHNSQPQLPSGDVLIHAGDLTQSGSHTEMQRMISWIREQPFEHKIVIGGNHDELLDASRAAAEREDLDWGDIVYLENSTITLKLPNDRVIKIFGSPYSPKNGNWPFQYPRGLGIWTDLAPEDVDILVTHTPPKAHLDMGYGYEDLLRELWRTKPTLHVFGRMHEGYRQDHLHFDGFQWAYEDAVTEGEGILNLFRVIYYLLCSHVWPRSGPKCSVDNVSMVGGLRDVLCRRPITVYI